MAHLRLLLGDCVERMALMPEGSVAAVVCDPPYGLEFMGKEWDKIDWQAGGGFSKPGLGDRPTAWPSFSSGTPNPTCSVCGGRLRGASKCACPSPEWKVKGDAVGSSARDHGASVVARQMRAQQEWHLRWLAEAYRVLEAGGAVKAFGGTRTFHRLGAAMEEAGFVDVGVEAWGYSSGFPKSLDVSKAIDKSKGLERRVVGTKRGVRGADGTGHEKAMPGKAVGVKQVSCDVPVTAPASPEAELWDGWGTALKPAWEPVLVGRKP
jgi:site-specific DNA-methyltransferase (adenine-specific)